MPKLSPRLESILKGVKRRLLFVLVAFGVGASLTWQYRVDIFGYLFAPAGGQLSGTGKPIFTGPTEMFSITISLVMKGGLALAIPVLVYFIYDLFKPMFGKQARRTVLLFLWLMLIFYIGGMAFAYYVLLPAGLGFLLNFGTDIATPAIRITEYMELAMAMLFWLGIVFEIPILMMLLAKLRLVSHTQFKKVRPYVPIAAAFLSMIITPTPDAVTMLLVAGPIWLLYEAGVFLAWLVRPKVRALFQK